MTIIAYRDGVMAGDTQHNANNQLVGYEEKVIKNHLGALWGASGDNSQSKACEDWFLKVTSIVDLRSPPPFSKGQGLLVFPDGNVFSVYDGLSTRTLEFKHFGFTAIGSGADFAMGAMAMGATAEQAVKVAIDFNLNCGGEITTIRLDNAPSCQTPAH
jgi:hypothetical protein